MKKLLKTSVALSVLLFGSGCRYFEGDNLLTEVKDEPSTASTFGTGPEKIWVDKAKENFKRGEYGLAERYYRQAVEERHNNVEAWLGLAASYDRLKRFDEADKAYQVVTSMIGNTPTVLNNLGYHYMLKGDLKNAERLLREAESRDPTNPHIKSNLSLLANWKVEAGKPG